MVIIASLDSWLSKDEDVVHMIYCLLQIVNELCEIVEYLTFLKGNRILKARLNKFLMVVKAVRPVKVLPAMRSFDLEAKLYFDDLERAW
uniref:Uncharacterized protein n=1 Tax=Romanomermis culicivorax TaxID=13658 RepID=A0A915IGU8_ROMCU